MPVRTGRHVIAPLVFIVAAGFIAGAGPATASHGGAWHVLDRVSVSVVGGDANGASGASAISGDARFVAFISDARNLVSEPAERCCATNSNVFLRDRVANTTTQVDVDVNGDDPSRSAEGGDFGVDISNDGRYVVFASDDPNLTTDSDTNGTGDVFVRDVVSKTTRLVSVGLAGDAADGASLDPAISADGRFVVFVSHATDLVPEVIPGPSAKGRVYRRDLVEGETVLVNVGVGGTDPDSGGGGRADISGDGRYIVWHDSSTNLTSEEDGNGSQDIFLRDMQTGVTRRVSVAADGGTPDRESFWPVVSDDGRYVAFYSSASNLIPGGDSNNMEDVYLRDMLTGEMRRLSIGLGGAETDGGSAFPSMTPDGGLVFFYSWATNLIPGDGNGVADIFVWERSSDAIDRVAAADGSEPDGAPMTPRVSADGRNVSFHSGATNLVFGDGNQLSDVFVAFQEAPPPPPEADLAITKTDSPDPVVSGNNLTYTITVKNNGPGDATGVVLTDRLSPQGELFDVESPQGSCSGVAVVTCQLGALASGSEATVQIVATPAESGEIRNAVEVAANESDPDLSDNTAVAETQVEPAPFEELALRFAPILILDSEEAFRPISRAPYVGTADLRTRSWRTQDGGVDDATLPQEPRLLLSDLSQVPLDCAFSSYFDCYHFLDVESLDPSMGHGTLDYWTRQEELLADGSPITVYWHVHTDKSGEVPLTVQYWFFYLFNDLTDENLVGNRHEADWEQITVRFNRKTVPISFAYAAHNSTGQTRSRNDMIADGQLIAEHPIVYVARGSHASYFSIGEHTEAFKKKECVLGLLCKDSTDGQGDALADHRIEWICSGGEVRSTKEYMLRELKEPVFAEGDGDYGSGNFISGLLVQGAIATDPQRRAAWMDPVAFVENARDAVKGDRPGLPCP